MSAYLTPGVYRRPQPVPITDIRRVRTDVVGFVGFAERGPLPSPDERPDPLMLAVRLTSWKEFVATFGGFIPYGYLAYAVRAFFENGGSTCYVVRVAATHHAGPLQRPRAASFALPGAVAPQQVATLASAIPGGQREATLSAAGGIQADDLIAIEGSGVTEFTTVVAVDETRLSLGRTLEAEHAAGEAVFRYTPALRVTATSAGNWGNRIRLAITPLTPGPAVREFSLRVTVEPGRDVSQPVQEEFYPRLSLVADDLKHAPTVIASRSQLIQMEQLQGAVLIAGGADRRGVTNGPLAFGPVRLEGGRDGVSGVAGRDFTGGPDELRGIRLLEEIDEVAVVCAPDVVLEAPPVLKSPPPPPRDPCAPPAPPPKPDVAVADPTATPSAFDPPSIGAVHQAMIEQCDRLRDRVTIIDPPDRLRVAEVAGWPAQSGLISRMSRFAALYYPWLKVPDALALDGPTRRVPPSGHVAGVYARVDNQFGVHRPPANAALEFIVDVGEEVTDQQQENLNPYGINVIRSFAGRGIRVWGARSLAARDDSDWRFIHVRRLMSMIEESVDESTQWAVFERNDHALRRTLVHSLSVFLEAIWRRGGLKGELPAQGFFVTCDETNNPASIVASGQIVCQVGVAVAAPMEFLIFEVRQSPGAGQIVEQ